MAWVVCRTGGCPWHGEVREVRLRVPLGAGLHAELVPVCACGTPAFEVASPAAARLAMAADSDWLDQLAEPEPSPAALPEPSPAALPAPAAPSPSTEEHRQ
jgi:hypothetical protein